MREDVGHGDVDLIGHLSSKHRALGPWILTPPLRPSSASAVSCGGASPTSSRACRA